LGGGRIAKLPEVVFRRSCLLKPQDVGPCMKNPQIALLGGIFGLKERLSTKSCDRFVRVDPPTLFVPVPPVSAATDEHPFNRRAPGVIDRARPLVSGAPHQVFQFLPALDQRGEGERDETAPPRADVVFSFWNGPVLATGAEHRFG